MLAIQSRIEIFIRTALAVGILFNALTPASSVAAASRRTNTVQPEPGMGMLGSNTLSSSSNFRTGSELGNQNVSYQITSCQTDGDLVIANGETCSLEAGTYSFDSIMCKPGEHWYSKEIPTKAKIKV